jgi:hypothetical protein
VLVEIKKELVRLEQTFENMIAADEAGSTSDK